MDSNGLLISGVSVNKKGIGSRIRQIREEMTPDNGQKKVTQEQFYLKICPDDIANGQKIVSQWETQGTSNLDTLAKIATLGHKSLDWLILGKGAPGEGPRDMAAMANNNSLTLRDYCKLLFVDMHDKFNSSWKVTAPTEGPRELIINIPLAIDIEKNIYHGRESSATLAVCANTMNDIYSRMPATWDSNVRGVFENAIRQSINAYLDSVPAVPVENGGSAFKIKGEK